MRQERVLKDKNAIIQMKVTHLIWLVCCHHFLKIG